MREITTLKWENQQLFLLDQTQLPNTVTYTVCGSLEAVHQAIQRMIVRGAPAIGVAAGYAMVLAAGSFQEEGRETFLQYMQERGEYLKSARPTAVNLGWAVDRIMGRAAAATGEHKPLEAVKREVEAEAAAIHREDRDGNRKIGENLLSLLKDGDTVLTHCNAGSLATSEYGTALSVFYMAKEKGMELKAYADETRPRLQGANLTAFELMEHGVDVTLICDNMAALVMSQGKIDAVIVGCDRVAANGDTANKIGTFSVSVLAKQFGIPVYIAAPTSTIDLDCPSGARIPIEERSGEEITVINGEYVAPKEVKTYNPAFDVTPAEYLTAIVTEKGIVYPPYPENFKKLRRQS